MKYDRFALIPAYQPGSCLAETAEELAKKGFSVIIVNDGSGKMYQDRFREFSAYSDVLIHIRHHGKAAALRTGLVYIRENFQPPYAVVTLDDSGIYSPDEAVSVIERAVSEPDEMIIGSRKLKDNCISRLAFRLFSGLKVREPHTALRAFTDQHIDRMLEILGESDNCKMMV